MTPAPRRRARPLALAALVAWSPGCRRASPPPDAARGANAGRPYPSTALPPPELVSLPLRPPNCRYLVRTISPNHPQPVAHDDRFGAQPAVRNLHLTYAGEPTTSVVVQWSTDAATLASEVRFGEGDAPLERVARGYSFTYGPTFRRREHEVHVCGLAPGRRYRYDAGGAAARSRVYEFVTAPDGPAEVHVMVAGDARTNPDQWAQVAARAGAQRPDVMFFTGDAVNDGSNQSLWDAFFAAGADLFATTPALWADGNHEDPSQTFYAQFALPDNGTPFGHEHWYAVTYGPIRLVVLNDTTVAPATVTGIETQYLAQQLAAVDRARTPWVVAMHHRPIYTSSNGHLPDLLTRRAWSPLFDERHVDLDLSGHMHNYESTLPLRAGAVTDAAHGTRYVVFGGAGAPLYRFLRREAFTLTRERAHGFGMLTASSTRLHWDAYRADGTVIEALDLAP